MKISLLKNVFDKSTKNTIEFENYFDNIKNCVWQNDIIEVRLLRGRYKAGEIPKKVYQDAKTKIPCVTASGCFSYCDAAGLIEHSGIIAIDFDEEDNPEGIEGGVLAADAYTYAIHRSIGGDGWVVYVKIDPKKHLEAFLGLEAHYANNYQLVADNSCKDVSRLRYISADENAVLVPNSKVFKNYLEPKKIALQGRVYTQQPNDIEHIINQISMGAVNLVDNYHDWLNVGFAFAREYGEGGRSYFHDVSRVSPKYNPDDTDKKYTHLLGRCTAYSGNQRKAGIGTFVALAGAAGLETKTPRTTFIETVARSRRNMVGQNGGFKDVKQAAEETEIYLKKMEKIEGEDVPLIIDRVMQMSDTQLKNSLVGDLVADAKLYVKSLDLRFNEITKGVEFQGKNLEDYQINSLYLNALNVLKSSQKGKVLGKEMFNTILESDVIPTYHPFMEFFNKNAHLKPKGNIDRLLECIIFDPSTTIIDAEKLRLLTLKWLLGLIMSAHGTYSILCLVLCGKMGKGKTEFFRGLLPISLRGYFAESKLDAGKDDEILMTQKLILLDDEFGGKSKSDAKKMRELLSKQRFTVRAPYARKAADLLRIACLCGTSNEKDVLADLEGNRRIIPLNIQHIDFQKYNAINKDELFIELYNLYKEIGNEGVFLTDGEIQDLNRMTEQNEETCQELEGFFMFFNKSEGEAHTEWLTPTEIRTHIEMNTRLKISPKRLGAALKKVGIEPKSKKIGGIPLMRYAVLKIYPTT